MKPSILSLCVASALLALSGCSTQVVAPMRAEVNANANRAEQRLKELQTAERPRPGTRVPAVEQVRGERWLPAKRVVLTEAMTPSVKATLAREFTVNRSFSSVTDLAERVSQLTGVPVIVAQDAANAGNPTGGANPPGVVAMSPQTPGLPPLPGALPQLGSQAMPGIALSYNGPLSGFLNSVAARYGISWEWTKGTIRFYRYTTKSFQISTLPGDSSSSIRVGSGGGASAGGTSSSSSGSSGSSQDASISATLSIWNAMRDSISNMLSPSAGGNTGGRVVITPATGSVTVTDTPQVLAQVEHYINEQNALMARQVVVEVRVLTVDITNAENYGIDWTAAYSAISGNFAWAWASAFQAADAAAGSLTLRIPPTAGATTGSAMRAWQGSAAVLHALSSQGHVTELTSGTIRTLNNQVAPLSNARLTSYVQSSTTTLTPSVGATTTLSQSQFSTGFNMNVLPHLLDGDRLMLQYAFDLSALRSLASFTSGGSQVQSPDLDSRSSLQRVLLRSGETLVLAGFEQINATATSQGLGSAENTALGGGVNGRRGRTQLIILIRATIEDQV